MFYESSSRDEVSAIYQITQMDDDIFADYQAPIVQKELERTKGVLQNFGLDVEEVEDKKIPIVPAVFLCEKEEAKKEDDNEYDEKLYKLIETAVWNCKVRESEKKNGVLFSVGYDDQEQRRIDMESDSLQNRVNNIVNYLEGRVHYNDRYDFIWNYIIWKASERYCVSFKDDKESIRKVVQSRYEWLKDHFKIIHLKGIDKLIDIYTIASCYMAALMDEISSDKMELKEDAGSMAKYRWILDVGIGFLYMWILSEEKEPAQKIIYNLFCEEKLGSLCDDKVRNRYLQLLAFQEKRCFDILCFAELLRWIEFYIKGRILALPDETLTVEKGSFKNINKEIAYV